MTIVDRRLNLTESFGDTLQGWFASEMAWLHGHAPWPQRWLLMGFPLWGDAYIDRFLRFCLPSLLAPANREALSGNCWFVIYYAAPDFPRILDVSRRLDAAGLTPILRQIPDEIMAKATGVNANWVLGTVHKLLIQMAARCGAGFHMAQPDQLYGRAYFRNLKRVGVQHTGIAQAGISASETIEREWAPVGKTGALILDGDTLDDLGFRHLHPQMRMHIMNNRDLDERLPRSTWLIWIAEDCLVLQRPHMHCAWMSSDLCRRAPLMIPNTLDAEMPWFMPKPYFAKAGDGLGMLEISGPEKQHAMAYLDRREFCLNYWMTVRFQDAHQSTLQQLMAVPIARQATSMPMERIAEQAAAIPAILMGGKAQAALDYVQREHFPEIVT